MPYLSTLDKNETYYLALYHNGTYWLSGLHQLYATNYTPTDECFDTFEALYERMLELNPLNEWYFEKQLDTFILEGYDQWHENFSTFFWEYCERHNDFNNMPADEFEAKWHTFNQSHPFDWYRLSDEGDTFYFGSGANGQDGRGLYFNTRKERNQHFRNMKSLAKQQGRDFLEMK